MKKKEFHSFRLKCEKEVKKHFKNFHSNPNQNCDHSNSKSKFGGIG